MVAMIAFDAGNVQHIDWLAALWNRGCGEELAVSADFVRFNTRPSTGGVQAGRMALEGKRPAGFVLASAHPGAPPAMPRAIGWIDAIVVAPPFRRRGIGSALLAWAEAWLVQQGVHYALSGGSLRPFAPGLPPDTGAEEFFAANGYVHQPDAYTWDVARDLSTYTSPPSLGDVPGAVRAAQPGDEDALLAFLRREFPGRWTFEAEEFLRNGGRISDYMLLWTESGVDGACRLTFEDSAWPMERFYPYRLPRPWGQLGSIGVSRAARGRGFGLALLDGGLRRLRHNGVNGCVIDWTTILDFYAKVGFKPYRKWAKMAKEVEGRN